MTDDETRLLTQVADMTEEVDALRKKLAAAEGTIKKMTRCDNCKYQTYSPCEKMVTDREHLVMDIASLLNRYNREKASDTPDYILAGYMVAALESFEGACRIRDAWYGQKDKSKD